MRRVKETGVGKPSDERGVIAPLTAALMVALLGIAAFAIDTARIYSEHAQLQNGADASALAVAESCAKDLHLATCQHDLAHVIAIADANALDGATEFVHAKVRQQKNGSTVTGGIVDVEVQSKSKDGKKEFPLLFAPVLGFDTADIRASAQARYDGYSRAHVMPLTFSQCESDPDLTKGLQFFRVHGHSPKTECTSKTSKSKSGMELPGGFGWLVHDVTSSDPCNLSVTATNTYKSDSGNDVPADCKTKFSAFQKDLEADKTVEVLVPIFDEFTVTGADKVFRIEAFAQISLRGWRFQHGSTYLTTEAKTLNNSMGLGSSDSGLFGRYVKKVTLAEAAVLGGPATYSALGIRLSN